MKFLTFAVVLLLSVCLGAAQTPSTTPATAQSATPIQNIKSGPVLEYVSDHDAVVAWTSTVPTDMKVNFDTNPTSLTKTADAVENPHGTNHRVKLNNLQPNTTYYFQMTAGGQLVGSVFHFQTVPKGAAPNRTNVNLGPK
jgi:phosphodiesterase/alkaline phosphatase D-like protein